MLKRQKNLKKVDTVGQSVQEPVQQAKGVDVSQAQGQQAGQQVWCNSRFWNTVGMCSHVHTGVQWSPGAMVKMLSFLAQIR